MKYDHKFCLSKSLADNSSRPQWVDVISVFCWDDVFMIPEGNPYAGLPAAIGLYCVVYTV